MLYIEADGSMVPTREEGWKETKLGRIFKSSDCIHAGEKQGCISNSQYIAHLGGHKKFTEQMEYLTDSYAHSNIKLVFITDGAPWLRNRIEGAFPSSHSILDYYHGCECLHAFSSEHFTDKAKEKEWNGQKTNNSY